MVSPGVSGCLLQNHSSLSDEGWCQVRWLFMPCKCSCPVSHEQNLFREPHHREICSRSRLRTSVGTAVSARDMKSCDLWLGGLIIQMQLHRCSYYVVTGRLSEGLTNAVVLLLLIYVHTRDALLAEIVTPAKGPISID